MTARYQAHMVAEGDWRIQDTTTGMIGPRWHLNWCGAQAQADQLNADDQANRPNPNADRVPCPQCASAVWTMPYGVIAPGRWICVSCSKTFVPPKEKAA